MLENMLKWMTDSDTNLTIVCKHHWSRKMTMKVDKYLKLSARTAVFISRRYFFVIYAIETYHVERESTGVWISRKYGLKKRG